MLRSGTWGRFAKLGQWLTIGASTAAIGIGLAHAEQEQVMRPSLGVFLWGDNSKRLIDNSPEAANAVTLPVRVSYFNNIKLRDLAVTPKVAAAVLKNGDVIEWTSPHNQTKTLGGKNIIALRATATGDRFVALSKNGTIYVWEPQLGGDGRPTRTTSTTKELKTSLGWFEKICEISVGDDHVAALTTRGHILTALLRELPRHEGQLGLASFPHFDPAPAPYELHPVKLLENSFIAQIASGSHHVLARAKTGEVFGFGRNTHGQLTLAFAYQTNKVSAPAVVTASKAGKHSGRFTNIAAGGDVSYLQDADNNFFVAGSGITGQFGTGSFAHAQPIPLKISAWDSLTEYNEKAGAAVRIVPTDWSVGTNHTFVKLSGVGRNGGDWMAWGTNLFGQLGNGKKATVVKPQFLVRGGLGAVDQSLVADTLVAGSGISGGYTHV